MCGIAGILGIQDISLGKKVIKNMTDAIAHRGPDAEGHFVAEKVALGHRRLSIIDLSEAANQPFIDHSGRYQVIFNGEMYNFQEVKDKLPDYPYRTNGDTEVLLAAYEKWGKDCLQYFNGMFAFALWDTQTQELWVVRDRLGIKPFYYYLDNQYFIFASEIRAILASDLVTKQLNATALMDYLTYYSVNAPQTLIQNIVQLMPGEYAVYQNGKLQKTTYWKIENNYVGKIEPNETQIKQKVKDLMQASIQRRMVSDVPLGAFLSGGIDSSAVVALMAEGSSQPVNTFSIVFNEKDYDESDYSNLIAKKYNTKHTPLLLRPTDFLKELPAALNAMDNPSGDGINTYVVSKATKQAGVTVALSGLGGDELFAGYPVFQQWHKLAKYRSLWGLPQFLRKGVGVMAAALKNDRQSARLAELISVKNANFANVYPTFRKLMVAEELAQLTKGLPIDYNSVYELLAERETALEKLPLLSQVSVGELLSYTLNVLIKDTDQMSMASALEVREPFFDYELVQYVMQIPDAIKFPKYSKSLLVEALSPRLPDEIVHRKKMGFVFPWEHWMRNELKDLCTQRLTKLAQHRFFQQSELLSRWQRFLQKDPKITWVPLWSMVVLADWMEKNGVE
ncbi:MAG: asparagine synthase (glutamine-hydrolyzing) [Bacteroidia bacterium]